MSRSAFSLATSRLSCELLGLHLAVAWKGLLWIVGELLHPVAQLRRVNVQVLRRPPIGHASILDQAHRLKLELPRKLPSLHDPPPAPSKHLTRCLRNRVQATMPVFRAAQTSFWYRRRSPPSRHRRQNASAKARHYLERNLDRCAVVCSLGNS